MIVLPDCEEEQDIACSEAFFVRQQHLTEVTESGYDLFNAALLHTKEL